MLPERKQEKIPLPIDCAFYQCDRLVSITLPFVGENQDGTGNTRFDYVFGESGLLSALKTVVITGGTSIASKAFAGCNEITSITLPSSVLSIASDAFSDCIRLDSIKIDSGNAAYQSSGNCIVDTSSKTLVFGCRNSVIPTDGSVTAIGDGAFVGCNGLKSIVIPDSVTSIGARAFKSCTSLASISLPNIVKKIGTEAFFDTAYYNNSANWDNGALYIGNHFIEADFSIEGRYIVKEGTKTIAGGAFTACIFLSRVILPGSLVSIGDYAFAGLEELTSITIRSQVEYIGSFSFNECVKLDTIDYKGTKDMWTAIEKGDSWNADAGDYIVTCADANIGKDGEVI